MGVMTSYRLRLWRKRLLWRAWSRRRDLSRMANRLSHIKPKAILLFATMRNERVRLPYFLKYYRDLGVDHFLLVDNGSTDGTAEYLAAQPDVSLWTARGSYKRARFGVDWLNWLKRCHGSGHWCLTVDCDEFLIYPFCETRPLLALTDWLDASSTRSMSAMTIDMYPRGRIADQPYTEGQDPFEIACWFDSGNYMISKNELHLNLWIQGGPRARVMFANQPENAPALNKVPLVKWGRGNAYVSSTHMILPRGLNIVYGQSGGERLSGCLLHAKFLDTFTAKAQEEMTRHEHYANSKEYRAYLAAMESQPDLWCRWSERFVNWRQLEIIGLMSKGTWE